MSDEIPIVNATMTTFSIYLSWFLINVNVNFSTAFVGDRLCLMDYCDGQHSVPIMWFKVEAKKVKVGINPEEQK